jgi:uncharacterized membrane-anchored protein
MIHYIGILIGLGIMCFLIYHHVKIVWKGVQTYKRYQKAFKRVPNFKELSKQMMRVTAKKKKEKTNDSDRAYQRMYQ